MAVSRSSNKLAKAGEVLGLVGVAITVCTQAYDLWGRFRGRKSESQEKEPELELKSAVQLQQTSAARSYNDATSYANEHEVIQYQPFQKSRETLFRPQHGKNSAQIKILVSYGSLIILFLIGMIGAKLVLSLWK